MFESRFLCQIDENEGNNEKCDRLNLDIYRLAISRGYICLNPYFFANENDGSNKSAIDSRNLSTREKPGYIC